MSVVLALPWPPSVNSYWRHVGSKTLLSQKGREYRLAVQRAVHAAGAPKMPPARLSVRLDVFPPDRRVRDLDNLAKALLDGLERSGVYESDALIDDLHIVRGDRDPDKLGVVRVELSPLDIAEATW